MIEALDAGLDSVIGDGGVDLSSGERQRLALAHALLRHPRLLILDEATASSDLAGERAILDAMRACLPDATVLFVSHRPESLARCDRVLRFEKGRLTESDSARVQSSPTLRRGRRL